jgi:hypothetical protein
VIKLKAAWAKVVAVRDAYVNFIVAHPKTIGVVLPIAVIFAIF